MLTRPFAKLMVVLVAESLFCLAAQSQTTYHFHKETANTGYDLLSTAGPDSASTTLTTSDLKGKTGSTWIANWATTTGVPNSAGTVLANSTFQFSLWMNKSASFGTLYPVITVGKLDANQNATSWATATASTALTTTLTKLTFSFTLPAAQNMVATDRWWVEVGAYIPSGGSTTHSVTASFAFEGSLNGNYDSTGVLPAIVRIPVSLAVTPQNPYVAVGSTQQFTAIGTYSDGSTADLTGTAGWSSSSTQVATVNSAGLMTAQAVGGSTISASLGTVSSSSSVTITKSALVSISISPPNPSLPTGLTTQLSAIGNFADGSTQDFTRTVSWVSSQPPVATITSAGTTTGLTQGTTAITATLSTFTGSATLSVSAPALINAVISPGSAFLAPGTTQQFSATGSYSDGSSQDITSTASWASSASSKATVNSTGLVTAVSTGTTVISVSASGLTFLANITVTSPGPPAITASVSPAPNAAGWNNSPVTVTFACIPGGAPITNCPAPQVVSSEGVSQTVTGTVTDSSGNASSTTVTVNIDETPPVLTVSSPSDGSTLSSATVTPMGSLFDSLSGLSTLTCNGIAVTLSGSSFSCNISLNPGINLIAVRATDIAGNVTLTKIHVTYPVYPVPTSITITPTNVNLAVGQTQQFTAIDNQGRPRPDATWSLPNHTTVATITTGSSPVLTANAVGQVALTAKVAGISVQTTVNIVTTVGSYNWTASSGGQQVFQAVPNSNGPDLFSQDTSGSLRAFTKDGQQLWQQLGGVTIPDALGGVLAYRATYPGQDISQGYMPGFLINLDAQTGSPVWWNGIGGTYASAPDGRIIGFGSDTQRQQPPLSVFVLNGNTGQRFDIPMPAQSVTVTQHSFSSPNCVPFTTTVASDATTGSNVVVDADGNTYLEYLVQNTNQVEIDGSCAGQLAESATTIYKLSLMTIFADGSTTTQVLATRTYSSQTGGQTAGTWSGSFLSPGWVTPDGQGGVLATWWESIPYLPYRYMVSHVSPTTGQADFYLQALQPGGSNAVVLDDNGTGYATGTNGSNASNIVMAFDINSGNVFWTAQPGMSLGWMYAQDGGGVILRGNDLVNGNSVLTPIDSSGNIGAETVVSRALTHSWGGQWFSGDSGLSPINIPFVINQASLWPETYGNPSQNSFGVPECPCLIQSSDVTLTSQPQSSATMLESETAPETVQSTNEGSPLVQLSGPSNCPICILPQPEPPQCVTFAGSVATYLILVGDPGIESHNLHDLLNLAAQTKANDLIAQGNKVIACRISSVTDFNFELTNNGLITGDVMYFGHSGEGRGTLSDGTKIKVTGLFIGQSNAPDTNLIATESGPGSYRNLCGIGCNIDNFLRKTSSIRLYGCKAGADIMDYYKQFRVSIAQLISNELLRGVYAYKGGVYFSQLQVNDPLQPFTVTKGMKDPPDSLPMYAVPDGPPGNKPQQIGFCPGGKCQ